MLGKYLTINSVKYPNPVKFESTYKNNEAVNTSEVYTELVSVNRLAKYGFNATFQVTSRWYQKILEDCRKPSSSVIVGGAPYVGRLRIGNPSLEENSENTPNTNGLWTIKVSFTER